MLTSAVLFRSPLEGYTLCLPSITSGHRGSAFSFSHAVLQECSRTVPSARAQLPQGSAPQRVFLGSEVRSCSKD